jgi:hypothetical protein
MLGTITLPNLEILNATIFGGEVNMENVMLHFPHSKGKILVDTTVAHIKVEKLEITRWTLPEDHQV